jgi:serine/threonine protein kinase
VARFAAERQALAQMEHPSIARLFDAGAAADGRPYFVMELVHGPAITEHCRTEKLGVRERVTLFLEVCRALRHAHRRGVIHRDLKPRTCSWPARGTGPSPR